MPENRPLPERLRPDNLDDFQWPEGAGSRLVRERLAQGKAPPSLILWGLPGTGKTTLARLILKTLKITSKEVSAVSSGAKELKQLGEDARKLLHSTQKPLLLFVDEIHRFNRAQQDVLLPFVEEGSLLLIGATTENPSFELNAALLSRVSVISFPPHTQESLTGLYKRAHREKKLLVSLNEEALNALANASNGDARWFLHQLDQLHSTEEVDLEILQEQLPEKLHFHDKDRDQHYDLISALHKSVRSSDVQGSLYWLARMLEAGEDRRFLLRRIIRMATEDVGLADPQAVGICTQALQGFELLGSPEGDLLIYQATAYVAACPKSNSIYLAAKKLRSVCKQTGQLPVPMKYRNAVTRFMEKQGYGEGYVYDHDVKYHCVGQSTLPQALAASRFYEPGELGFEREMKKRLEFWQKLHSESQDV